MIDGKGPDDPTVLYHHASITFSMNRTTVLLPEDLKEPEFELMDTIEHNDLVSLSEPINEKGD